jgi:hypothetical protein
MQSSIDDRTRLQKFTTLVTFGLAHERKYCDAWRVSSYLTHTSYASEIDLQSPMQFKNEQVLHDSCNGVGSFYSEITISLILDEKHKSLFILLHKFVGYS